MRCPTAVEQPLMTKLSLVSKISLRAFAVHVLGSSPLSIVCVSLCHSIQTPSGLYKKASKVELKVLPCICCQIPWPGPRTAGLNRAVVSVMVPPRAKLRRERNGLPNGAPVLQSRSVTSTRHVPSSPPPLAACCDWALAMVLGATIRTTVSASATNPVEPNRLYCCDVIVLSPALMCTSGFILGRADAHTAGAGR